ncbi:MAG TPA: hypothetical protein VEC76_10780 [Streptosporangiaceae bacterium]|nr:hypothetical protein [Streptosporangiaceae bacterium]
MSAETVPDLQAARGHLNGNGARPQDAATTLDATVRRRNIIELCRQFAAVCASAVDPLEISSALEFEGLNDHTARERYGVPDVFALGEEMYRQMPRHPAEPEPQPDPWRVSKFRPVLHGLLYGLPTVCFTAAGVLLAGTGAFRILIVALLSSWTMSQGLAYLGYRRLGSGDLAQTKRLLRFGLAAGLAGVDIAFAIVALLVPVPVPALIFGFGLGAYMLGATVLLILGAERLLFIVLTPGVLGSMAFLLLGRPPQLEHAAWAALAATPLLAIGLALARTSGGAGRRRGEGQPWESQPAGRLVTSADLMEALPSAGFGLVAAGLVVYPVVAGTHGHGGVNTGALLASLPLTLSMGAAEWMLIWYRRRSQRLLRRTRELRKFAIRARLLLFAALLQYLAAAALLIAAVVAIAVGTGLVHPQPTALPQIVAYLLLGGALFLALLLQAFGSRAFPLVACTLALAFEISYRGLGVSAQIFGCAELLIVLAAYAALVLGRAVRHAC